MTAIGLLVCGLFCDSGLVMHSGKSKNIKYLSHFPQFHCCHRCCFLGGKNHPLARLSLDFVTGAGSKQREANILTDKLTWPIDHSITTCYVVALVWVAKNIMLRLML